MTDQKEMERLAPRMAVFTGIWRDEGNGGIYKLIPDVLIVDHFSSPAGFVAVLDKLDEKFKGKYYVMIKPPVPSYPYYLCHMYECNRNAFSTDCVIFEGIGPDRATALYSAVDKLMEGEG